MNRLNNTDSAVFLSCLAADTCLTADPVVASLITARSQTFVEIDHGIISTVVLLPSTDSRRVIVSYKYKFVHEVLVNCLVKLADVKSVVRWTDRSYWLGPKESNRTKIQCTPQKLKVILAVPKIVSEYDLEIPQSHTADNPMAPRGRATQSHLFRSNPCWHLRGNLKPSF